MEIILTALLENLIKTYGYWAMLIGTFLEGETILIIGGFVAYLGYLKLSLVMLIAFIGSFSVSSDFNWRISFRHCHCSPDERHKKV
ncbi:MAG: hypothetical protein A2Y81_02175 [Nitrospirae bacterium RBG_13_43_8]|nr:MAG: hypothetical protein A2Y81_02175 [Nitrospirae bacterium RBG_13_43_8]